MFQRKHVANMISIARLGFLPFIVLAGILKLPVLFVGLFAAQAFLDAIDGAVARRLRIESDLGRWLDSVIDLAIWLPSMGVFVALAWDVLTEAFEAYPHLFIIPVITSGLMYATAYAILHAVAAIHLYSGKLTGALVLLLMLTMLFDQFYPLLGYLTACVGVVYHVEAIAIYVLKRDQADENVTSIVQVLRRA